MTDRRVMDNDRLLTEQEQIKVQHEFVYVGNYLKDGKDFIHNLLKAQDAKTYAACNKEWQEKIQYLRPEGLDISSMAARFAYDALLEAMK